MMDVYERAQRYVAKMPAAVSGQAGHNSTFAVAIALVRGFSLGVSDARLILNDYNQRCEPPWSASELEHKLQTAATWTKLDKADGYLLSEEDSPRTTDGGYSPPQEVAPVAPRVQFENETLKNFAARWRSYVSTVWLADRSAINPFDVSSDGFLGALYDRNEYVLIFTNDKSQGEAVWPRDTQLPRSAPNGVWFLSQPVDGKVYPNPRNVDRVSGQPKPSRRSEESVTHWRYLVLESDNADPRDWLGALVQLEMPIAAIYTSGRRSIHALVRLDAADLTEWRDFAHTVMKPILVKLGADRQVVVTAVRLSRLPGCFREGWTDKSGEYRKFARPQLQKLLYLNPQPEVKAICRLPRLRDVIGTLARVAEKHSPDAAKWIAESHAGNMKDCIAALEKRETFHRSVNVSRDKILRALEWFSTAEEAKLLLQQIESKDSALDAQSLLASESDKRNKAEA